MIIYCYQLELKKKYHNKDETEIQTIIIFQNDL
jgi:hypothetical protein